MEIDKLTILKDQNIKKYLLTANMETAINIFWDSQAEKKDTIVIIGMGTIGLLTAHYFKLKKYKNVFVSDINKNKVKYSKLLAFNFVDFKNIKNPDIIINTTSNYEVLKRSLEILNLDGKFIEASWYGSKQTNISLGGNFHSKRLKIISSQVSNIPKFKKQDYNHKKRLNLAIKALSEDRLINLINSESNFINIDKNYISILNDPNTLMHAIKYP
jgi:threonine dehydrogenase-like Zn-dependent dehydrogenase